MSESPKRRWFQFSIREVALLVLALGFAMAWYRERKALLSERETWKPIREMAASLRSHPSVPNGPFNTHSMSVTTDCDIDGERELVTITRYDAPARAQAQGSAKKPVSSGPPP
jgi:hypothetical protein